MLNNKFNLGDLMKRFFRKGLLYFTLLCFIVLNLSCESETQTPFEPDDDPNEYYFNIFKLL